MNTKPQATIGILETLLKEYSFSVGLDSLALQGTKTSLVNQPRLNGRGLTKVAFLGSTGLPDPSHL